MRLERAKDVIYAERRPMKRTPSMHAIAFSSETLHGHRRRMALQGQLHLDRIAIVAAGAKVAVILPKTKKRRREE